MSKSPVDYCVAALAIFTGLGLAYAPNFRLHSSQASANTQPVALTQTPILCTCNDYVVRAVPGYPDNTSAVDLESHALEEAGFVQLRRPEPGAIVLYQGYSPLAGAPQGHVEIVRSVSRRGVEVVTAGMSIRPGRSEAGCVNTEVQLRDQVSISAPGATYWRKQNVL